jgi:multicomponent Na+:H+ antiporter subunit E
MTLQILLNLLIGLVWMLLHDSWNALTFTIGYVIGLGLIYGMRRFFPTPFYARKCWAILKLFYLFIVELVRSTFTVIRQIARPRLNIEPGIFRVKTILKNDWEITLLCVLITLTPGSVAMEVAPEDGIIYLHAMDASEFTNSIVKTMRTFEKAILEVTY